ncbi:Hypothetical protein SMAX5B_010726 [Scophthalmus maximus]|uniref:Uncharacterized protein n=1 Tax=Scophthalmus maximus TaxID=52904 RepID=A0A2U9CK89_SCOMX|nr:Hypothetical protein SMAX5B_010726 [Scophthalmus maximus]
MMFTLFTPPVVCNLFQSIVLSTALSVASRSCFLHFLCHSATLFFFSSVKQLVWYRQRLPAALVVGRGCAGDWSLAGLCGERAECAQAGESRFNQSLSPVRTFRLVVFFTVVPQPQMRD